MKKFESNFCMSEFKLAIGILSVLVVFVIAWSTWSLRNERHLSRHGFHLSAMTTKPPAGAILVKDKMLHPYWGNCNQCHVTTDTPTKSVSNVFAGPPISIKATMIHEYWGNCNLCHQVTDGFQPVPKGNGRLAAAATAPGAPPPIAANAVLTHADWGPCSNCHQILPAKTNTQLAAATTPPGAPPPIAANAKLTHADWGPCSNCHQILPGNAATATPVAFDQLSAASLGLKVQAVTSLQMQQLGLISEDGIFILAVAPGSIADQAGLQVGDELIRIANIRLETMADFVSALAGAKPGEDLKVNLFRGRKSRNLFIKIPEILPQAIKVVATTIPMTQNQIETQAELLGVPKTAKAVQQALAAQQKTKVVAATLPMTQNQIETQAELLGVPKTAQAVQQALAAQQKTKVVAATVPMTQNQIETQAELLGVPKTAQAVQQALAAQQNAKVVAAPSMGMGIGNGANSQMQMINTPTYQMGIGNGTNSQMQMINTPTYQMGIGNGSNSQMQMINNPSPGLVAVAVSSSSLNSQIHPQFGSSPYFVLFDQAQNSYRIVGNPNFNDANGQGVQTAQYLADLGVQSVIVGNVTADCIGTLGSLRITPYSGVTGTASSVLAMFTAGQLQPTGQAPASVRAAQPAPAPAPDPRPATPNGRTFF